MVIENMELTWDQVLTLPVPTAHLFKVYNLLNSGFSREMMKLVIKSTSWHICGMQQVDGYAVLSAVSITS